MDDLISRQAILKHIEKIRQGVQMMDDTHRASIIMNGMYLCEKAVRNQPSAQPKRETGQWLDNETTFSETGRQTATCSVCGLRSTRPLGEFCRWCGAQMTEGDDKNEGD